MKAVNLIPKEQATAHGGRSGFAVYALLGVLAVLVAMSTAYTLAGRSVDRKRAEVTAVSAQADAAEAQAASYRAYTEFANTRKARVETVRNLLSSRFDWAHALHEVARTLPSGTWATSMRATVNPAVSVDGANDPLRAAMAVPAIELTGCSAGQDGVARTLSALRRMAGVQRVSLSSSTKEENAGGGASDSAGSGDATGCGTRPEFSLTVFFAASAASAATTAATTAATSGGTTP